MVINKRLAEKLLNRCLLHGGGFCFEAVRSSRREELRILRSRGVEEHLESMEMKEPQLQTSSMLPSLRAPLGVLVVDFHLSLEVFSMLHSRLLSA